jgi:hypothetical protein
MSKNYTSSSKHSCYEAILITAINIAGFSALMKLSIASTGKN